MTLFDLSDYHAEPTLDPNRPNATRALELIAQAEKERDLAWLNCFQHFIFRRGAELWSEADHRNIFKRRENAARNVASEMEVAS